MVEPVTQKTQLIDGRIVGGFSRHASRDTSKCIGRHKGPWRTVECCGLAGDDRDIIECDECGEQKNVACSFDEDFS